MTKRELRAHYRALCRSQPLALREQGATQITQHLIARIELLEAQWVGLFAGMDFLGEPNTTHLHDELQRRNVRLAYPRIDEHGLVFHHIDSPTVLRPGSRKLLEPPPNATQVPLGDLDVLLVPGLAFTKEGIRLGRGGGYYDRILADPECRALTIGLAFAFQIAESLPTEPHDQGVNWVATEAGVVI